LVSFRCTLLFKSATLGLGDDLDKANKNLKTALDTDDTKTTMVETPKQKTPTMAAQPASASTAMKHIDKNKMNYLDEANKNLKTALDDLRDCAAIHINKLEEKESCFGLIVNPPLPDSNIMKQNSDATILLDWLKEDGSGGELKLLYRSSRDGLSNENFHSKCDNMGRTVVIIETTNGGVVGGYTNTAWKSSSGRAHANADKAFLFALSGFGLSSPCKMKLLGIKDEYAIYNYLSYGPIFGGYGDYSCDLEVCNSSVYLNTGDTYERGPSGLLTGCYSIKEMEVFQVTNNPTPLRDQKKKKQPLASTSETKVALAPVNGFTKEVNDAINKKWNTLHELEAEVL
jgi:hypothetical protein